MLNGNADVWLIDTARGVPTRFTFDAAADNYPVWSSNGSRVVFASNRNGISNLYWKLSSGAGTDELLLESDQNKSPAHWSSDGRFLLFRSIDPQTGTDLWVMPLSSDKKPFPFLKTSFEEREGQFSPDGKWIAYQSNESSRFEIYVQPFPSNLCSCWDRAGSFRSPLTVARSRAGTGMARKSSTSRWTAR